MWDRQVCEPSTLWGSVIISKQILEYGSISLETSDNCIPHSLQDTERGNSYTNIQNSTVYALEDKNEVGRKA